MSKFKVGEIIQHQFCKMKLRVKFIGDKYLVGETISGNNPSVVQNVQYDLWQVIPEDIIANEYVLKRAWLNCGNDFGTFLKLVDSFKQDYIESSLP